jgi:hypothetical protein
VVLHPATRDCFIAGNSPNISRCGSSLIDVDSYGGWQEHALLLFTMPQAIPSNAHVLSADLALRLANHTSTTAKEVDLYQVAHSWTSRATWNRFDGTNAWTTPGGDTAGSAAATNTSVGSRLNTWYHWYPTALVQSWINGAAANDGMLLREQSSTSQSILYFNSSTSTTTAYRPSLTITWTT